MTRTKREREREREKRERERERARERAKTHKHTQINRKIPTKNPGSKMANSGCPRTTPYRKMPAWTATAAW